MEFYVILVEALESLKLYSVVIFSWISPSGTIYVADPINCAWTEIVAQPLFILLDFPLFFPILLIDQLSREWEFRHR